MEDNMMILAQDLYYSLDCRQTQLNNNVLVVGTSGAGKTRSIVTPNLLQAEGSYVVSDPKGNLYKKYGRYLQSKGYVVKCIDFVHPERSVHYNPLRYIHSTQDIVKMAYMLIYQNASHPDPFWDESSMILLSSVLGYLKYYRPVKEQTLDMVLTLLCAGRRDEWSNSESPLDLIMKKLNQDKGDCWTYRQYNKAMVAASKTWDSMLISLTAKLCNFDSEELTRMMSRDSLDLPSIGQRKTALFIVVSDTDRSMDNIANLLFTQAMNELCLYADEKCKDSVLPMPVRFIMDDFATNCRIDEFPRMISSIRSRGISAMLMIQAESQLKKGYDEDWRTIIGNCDTYIYLGGNDVETARAVSERCNKPLESVLNMPVGTNWIFRRGQKPINGKNFNLEPFLEEKMKSTEDRYI